MHTQRRMGCSQTYAWTLSHEEHAHLVLYEGTEIISYSHIQFWPHKRAGIRIIATDENKRNRKLRKQIFGTHREMAEDSISKTAIQTCHLMILKTMNLIQTMFRWVSCYD